MVDWWAATLVPRTRFGLSWAQGIHLRGHVQTKYRMCTTLVCDTYTREHGRCTPRLLEGWCRDHLDFHVRTRKKMLRMEPLHP